jgi:putative membrane protein
MQIQTSVILGVGCLILSGSAAKAQTAKLSPADRQFISMVATTDMTEAHEGQVAENQANRADVKDFAKTLIQDHTESYSEIAQLAAKTGISIPTGINVAKNREIQQLVRLKGARFDQQFDRDEIQDHQRALAIFKREAAHGQDADVKAYAAKMIPVLEKHLNLAEQCAKQAKHA